MISEIQKTINRMETRNALRYALDVMNRGSRLVPIEYIMRVKEILNSQGVDVKHGERNDNTAEVNLYI